MKKDASCHFVVGRRRSGKSTWLLGELAEKQRLIVVTTAPQDFKEGYLQAETLHEVMVHCRSNWKDGSFRICYRVMKADKEGCIRALSSLADLLLQMQKPYADDLDTQQITLAVDEGNRFFPQHRPKHCDGFEWAILQGGHWGIEIYLATQRPQLVSTDLRDNALSWIVFPLGGDVALKAVLYAVGSQHRELIQNLSNHQFVRFQDGRAEKGANPDL